MHQYILRLDDACERRDTKKWDQMEKLLDLYDVKPLVGVIPHCEDAMMEQYPIDKMFWDKVKAWEANGWTIAMHGYNHVYLTKNGGINPVNNRSEFAGISLELQREKIKKGIAIMHEHGIKPQVFFAPSHTFDLNTLDALRSESEIRIISDTIANDSYSKYSFTFVPQQSGQVRKLPFKLTTFCYHPNSMNQDDFCILERFLNQNVRKSIPFPVEQKKRRISALDSLLRWAYLIRRSANA